MMRCHFRKAAFLLLFLAASCLDLHATHQKAAELIVEHVSGYTYRAKLYTYTFTQTDVDRPQLEIGWGDGTSSVLTRSREVILDNDTKLNYYEGTHTYAGPGTYTLYMEDPNRNSGVVNIPNSVLTYMYISTTIMISPWLGEGNDSPVTTRNPVDDMACLGQRYEHNPGAYDPDGDSLSYQLIPCRGEGGELIPGYAYPAASDTFMIDSRSGTLVWDAPVAQGEYNAAILIEEWRNRIRIGTLTRDMQIIVRACDNRPPYIETEDSYCVEAGQTLAFPVWVFDSDGNELMLEAAGEIMQGGRRAGVNTLHSGVDSAVFLFYWNTELEDSRNAEYVLYLRAEDDGDPSLSSVKTVRVKVMPPPVRMEDAQVAGNGFHLAWTSALSPHAVAYDLYRKDYYGQEPFYDSCRTGIGDSSYHLLCSLPVAQNHYFDTGVEEGREYCYRAIVRCEDGDESRQSDRCCLRLRNERPLMTHASVEVTDSLRGKVELAWRAPSDLDSAWMLAREYSLYAGTSPDSLSLRAVMPFAWECSYTDSNLNTSGCRWYYQVLLDTVQSSLVSTVDLSSQVRTHRIGLAWDVLQPWMNYRYDVYRYDDSSAGFRLIGSTRECAYEDAEVEVERPYLYYVEAIGGYSAADMQDTLRDKSEQVWGMAVEGRPCQVFLALEESSCQPLSNSLRWDFDSTGLGTGVADTAFSLDERAECEASVSYYEIYRKRVEDEDYALLATVEGTDYEDADPGSWFCWYYVVGVNESGLAGEPSNEVFVNNWDCFSFNLPDVFTPNGDQWNETWTAIDPLAVERFHVKVVNRWGVTVFSSSDTGFSWNGKVNNTGAACPDGAYFYMAEFETHAQGLTFKKIQSGSVSILR